MSKRVLLAGLFHETHTFLEGTTGLSDFQIAHGEELLARKGDASPMGGLLEAADKHGWTILPTVDFRATPGAIVEDKVVETFWNDFQERAQPLLDEGVDAIYLVLHGAMAAQSLGDVEGEILVRIRELPGANTIPLFGVYDLHANFTETMADCADCLVGYRENPHIDARESAVRAARLLKYCFDEGILPKMLWANVPIVWPPTGVATANEPMCLLEQLAREIESENDDIWAVNVNAGYSFADTPDTGVSFSIVTAAPEASPPWEAGQQWEASDGFEGRARQQLAQLCHLALDRKAQGNVTDRPIDEVMDELDREAPGLTAIVEPSDNIGGGAPGDGTGILRAFVERGFQNAAVAIHDPEAVEALAGLSPGERMTLPIGGKGSRLDAGPLELEVEFLSRSDGRFELENKKSHLASMSGSFFNMGPTAVVRHKGITILLNSRRTAPFDLGQWRSQGIDPENLSFIGVKAAVAHRAAYDPITARSYWVDTPGPCTSNLKAFPYQNIRRPVFPLDGD
ncbi:MAG: M81 family metallopeptidase [Verrucomicrobiia bacterium]|jgi:microcystin degradation protein MlrC